MLKQKERNRIMKTMTTNRNIFDLPEVSHDAVCITTNGIIKKDGRAVMGRGIAKEANTRYQLDAELAKHLKQMGNIPHIFSKKGNHNCFLISFPTKEHWRDKSVPSLISQSARRLVQICDEQQIERCYLTPPGCGCGGLDWSYDVAPILKDLLDDRFVIVFQQ